MELSPTAKQTIYAFGALFNMLTLGMAYGFPAILIPALLDSTSDILVDKHQASWLASLSGASGLLLVLLVGPMMHIYGRRVTHFCITLPILFGWILTSISYSLPLLFLSRILHSLGGGAIYFLSICIGEFASPNNRTILLNMKMLFAALGITLIHGFGYFLHWRRLALVPIVPVAFSLIITFFWYETPDWLVSKGKFEVAEKVFFALRGRSTESEREIIKLIHEHRNKIEFGEPPKAISLKDLKSKVMWRPIALLCCAIILPEVGGRHFFPSYSIQLAIEISGDKTKGFFYTYVVDSISIISCLMSFFFVAKFKIRNLILCSSYLAATILATSALMIYIKLNYIKSEFVTWLILSLFVLYFFLVFSSTFAVSYILMGELLPLEYRAIGSVTNGIVSCIVIAGAVKVMPLLTDSLGVYGMLLVFSVSMLLTVLYLHYDLPETKDRTLKDISDYFKGKSSKFVTNDVTKKDFEMKTKLTYNVKPAP